MPLLPVLSTPAFAIGPVGPCPTPSVVRALADGSWGRAVGGTTGRRDMAPLVHGSSAAVDPQHGGGDTTKFHGRQVEQPMELTR
jgi:hypothetical protein